MNPGEARRWVEAHFGSVRRFETTERNHIPDVEFAAALVHLEHLPSRRGKDQTALELFLYAGCKKFDRWFAPSPPSVPATYRGLLRGFADALSARERFAQNAPVFQVHALRDDVYAAVSAKALPLDSAMLTILDEFQASLDAISVPAHPAKQPEMLAAKAEVATIIEGLKAGSLKTILRTTLPYPLSRQPLSLRLQWEGLLVTARMTAQFVMPPNLLTQTGAANVLRPLNSTRWQFGTTRVEVEIESLLDPSIQVPPLQIPAIEVPIDAWPNGLRAAYEVIYLCCWSLRGHPQYTGIWVPAPGDLGDIESVIHIPGCPEMAFIRRGHASLPFEIFTPTDEVLNIDLGEAPLSQWFRRCRVLAEQYAMHGEAREAIFWLNVGVESLLRSRMEAAVALAGVGLDLDVVDGGKTYWDEAKQLVAAQFPEIAEEIVWPSGGKKPSLFQQLNVFCAKVPGAPSVAAVKKEYGKVSRRRNDLFHGNPDAPISMDDVRKAMTSFEWLERNFCPSEA